MFHSSFKAEQMIEEAEDAVGGTPANRRLRDAHLYSGQAHTRALFAPFFAIAAVASSLLVGWAMFDHV
jgi:hypothetical protein